MSELRIPYPTERAGKRGLDLQKWGVLINTTFPAAQTEDAIINAWDLAQVRGLDVFSGHIAIVSQRRKVDNHWINQESCWLTLKAQIYTAHKTGAFAGIDPITFGPMVERTYSGFKRQDNGPNTEQTVSFTVPEYVTATVYRFVNGQRCAFSDTLFFDEAVPIVNKFPTGLWAKAPTLMLSKCAKAAALRLGFAECDYSADEMDGQIMNPDTVSDLTAEPQRLSAGPSTLANPTAIPASEFNEVPQGTDDVVSSFNKVHSRALRWLDRSVDAAVTLGAFDEAIDNIRSTLEPELHDISVSLVNGLKGIFADPRGPSLWAYLCEARRRGPEACDMASKEVNNQAASGKLSKAAADGANTVLNFNRALQRLSASAAA